MDTGIQLEIYMIFDRDILFDILCTLILGIAFYSAYINHQQAGMLLYHWQIIFISPYYSESY